MRHECYKNPNFNWNQFSKLDDSKDCHFSRLWNLVREIVLGSIHFLVCNGGRESAGRVTRENGGISEMGLH